MDVRRLRAPAFSWMTLIACLAGSSVWCLTSAARVGITFDEPAYVTTGVDRWRSGDLRGVMRLGTMPLPVDVATLPIYLAERITGTPFALGSDGRGNAVTTSDLPRVIVWSRAAVLVFWFVLLVYAWLAASALAGPWGGALAAALVASEPTLLAHASLATTDIALAACILAMGYHLHRAYVRSPSQWRGERWAVRVGVPGVWFGLALVSKASALVFGPLCCFAIIALHIFDTRGHEGPPLRLQNVAQPFRAATNPAVAGSPHAPPWTRIVSKLRTDALPIFLLGLILAFFYCGSDWRREDSFVRWAAALPPSPVASVMTGVADRLRIFSNAGDGLVRQIRHNIRGHSTFLLGRRDDRAIWYYFPAALAIKLTLPILFAPLALAVWRRRRSLNWPLVSAGVLLVASLTFRVQVGVRVVLPLVVFLILGAAAAVVNATRDVRWARARHACATCIVILVAWNVREALRTWPDGLRYINPVWNSESAGYRWISDSNYDWGQGLPELRRWQAAHSGDPLAVWYFGSDPAVRTGPWEHVNEGRNVVDQAAHVRRRLQDGLVAVSTTLLYGAYLPDEPAVRELRDTLISSVPIDRTSTFLIYDLRSAGRHHAADAAAVTTAPAAQPQ
jgi:hypothetical protein